MKYNPAAITPNLMMRNVKIKFQFYFLLNFLALMPMAGMAQLINDCINAQVVCTNDDLAFNPDGPGQNDYNDPDNDPGCIVALEQNSAWYYFQINPLAPPNLVLGFIISPNGGQGEDYDWALYGPNVDCGDLGSPIRCSSSAATCDFCPETGMGMGTTDVTEGPGTGDGFVMTLIVQPGQGFYLMIDNWLGTNNGFMLTWTDSAADYLNCDADPPCALYAEAGPDISACEGASSVLLDGDSSGNHGGETYSWSGTNGGTSYLNDPNIKNPTASLPDGFNGTITYTLTVNEDDCMSEDQMELTVHPLPTIGITQIGPFCANNPPQALSATPPGGVWSGASTGNTFNPVTNGPGFHTVTYTYTDLNNCSNSASIDIEVYVLPDVAIDPNPASYCDNDDFVQLSATGSGGAGGYEYEWTTPSEMASGQTYNASLSGTYTVMVTDDNGCTNTTSTMVTSFANPLVVINDPGPICAGLSLFALTADPPGGIFDGVNVSEDGELNPSMIPPGTYPVTYTYTDNNGCDGVDVMDITIISVPVATASNNGPLCQGTQILLYGETENMGTTISYVWSGPSGYASMIQNPTDATLGGNYILQVVVDDCPSALTATNVLQTPMPDAMATNDGPYCNGQSIQLTGSTTSTGTTITYAWSGPNTYTSDQQNPIDATTEGIYTLVITVDNCASQPVMTEVIFNDPPDANAVNTGPYCVGENILLTGSTTTSGTMINYNWSGPSGYQSSIQNPLDASAPGIYELIVTVDGCNSPIDSTTVIIHSLPQPVISGPASFCTGNSAILDAGGGFIGYTWEDASTNQMLEVFTAGTYQVTVTDVNGCMGTTMFSISEIASLTPMISGDTEFCEDGSTILVAEAGYVSYVWNTGETSSSIEAKSEAIYTVVVTDATGCTGSASVNTTINQNPIVAIGGSTTYCIGGFTVLDAGAGYNVYLWSDNSNTQTITVSNPGLYTVDVIDMNGCAGSGAVNVDESTSLSPVVTGGNSFCANESTTLNAGSGFANYIWSDGSGNQFLTVTVAGLYTVTVSDGQGCSGSSAVTVTEVTPPSAQVQPSSSLCNTIAGGSIINLYDLVISGDMTGSWIDLDISGAMGMFTNLNFDGVLAGDYRFGYTTNSAIAPCPEATFQTVITVIDCTCPDVFFFTTDPLCNAGDVLDMSTIENTNEAGLWSILQTPVGSNPATLTGTLFNSTAGDPGVYTLQFALQNQPPPGCVSDFQVIVEVDAEVDAGTATAPVMYCENDNNLIMLGSLLSGEQPNGFWTETSAVPSQGSAFNDTNGTFLINGQLTGTYSFQYAIMSNGACPGDASEVRVVINPLPTVVVVDQAELDCVNTSVTLDGSGSSSGASFAFSWSGPGIVIDGNENTLQPTADEPGNYILTITNTVTLCTNNATVTVNQNDAAPTGAVITSYSTACFGEQNGSITIHQVNGGIAPYEYSLNNSAFTSNPQFSNLQAGDFDLIIQDETGCRWDTMITLDQPIELTIDLGPDIEIGLGETAMVEAVITPPFNSISNMLIWAPSNIVECIDINCLEAIIATANTVTLSATVTDINGCEATDEVLIEVDKSRRIYFPNAFSPNGDGINDIFFVSGDDFQIVTIKKLMIYSRWGESLFEATDIQPNDASSGWNGYFREDLMNSGVFVYSAEVEFIDGIVKVYTGDVTLLR